MKRKSYLVYLFTIITLLATTSCGTALVSTSSTGGAAADPAIVQSTGGEMEMTQTQKLALGIIKLEDSSHPVTAEQAGLLVMLWKALRNITAEDTAIEAEKTALIKQIQGTLTSDQQQEIEIMDLNFSSMSEVATKLGIQMGSGVGILTQEQQATREAAMSSGAFDPGAQGGGPGGGGPLVEGGMMVEMGGFPGQQDSESAGMPNPGSGLGLPDQLVEALIQLLVDRSNSGE
ncbi:MAG: hypothetical protein A2Z16_00090 [Chloroflexi bacterium RBG_16_54_18]|nr:MAG: hypothetical protein A2Z16_00090 [Chloroflexi bacterium RBG_16_54_18]